MSSPDLHRKQRTPQHREEHREEQRGEQREEQREAAALLALERRLRVASAQRDEAVRPFRKRYDRSREDPRVPAEKRMEIAEAFIHAAHRADHVYEDCLGGALEAYREMLVEERPTLAVVPPATESSGACPRPAPPPVGTNPPRGHVYRSTRLPERLHPGNSTPGRATGPPGFGHPAT
jgi:hypothetical protein